MPVKRNYRAPHRERQARATRDCITAAARKLFAQQGYSAATIDAIAREADVAVQTIYATFGSKRAIALGLLDRMEQEAGMTEFQTDLAAAAGDPTRQIRQWVAFTRRLFQGGTDLLELANAAKATEPDVAAHVQEGERRRREGAWNCVRSWKAGGALREGLDEEMAVGIVWTLLSPEVFRLLTSDSGWSPEQYETWLVSELTLLLQPGKGEDNTGSDPRAEHH